MFSRSAIVKLKAILIIDLIIDAATRVYFYLEKQGLIAVTAKPAEFTLKNLTIDPPEAYPGDVVQISVNATNIGDLEGNHRINLEVNSAIKIKENITLASNSTEIVQLTDIETTECVYNVTVGNLNANFTIKPALSDSSKIILSNLICEPYEARGNQLVNVTATAQNPTGQADKIIANPTVDKLVVQREFIELNAPETEPVAFTVNATSEGTNNVKINIDLSSYCSMMD